MTTSLRQQAVAIETARRIIKGGKIKPRGNELDFLDQQLADAAHSARLFAQHETELRRIVKDRAA